MNEIEKEIIQKESRYHIGILKVTVFAILPISLIFIFLGTEIALAFYKIFGIKIGSQELVYGYIFICLLVSSRYLRNKKPSSVVDGE